MNRKPFKNPGFLVSSFVVAVLLVFQVTDSARTTADVALLDDSLREMQIFVEAYRVIQSDYVDTQKLDPTSLIKGAIDGMLESLGDPHSRFLPKKEATDLITETEGEFGGIGIHIGMEKERLSVIAPVEGTPAWKAGIEGGDLIISIDGKPTDTLTLDGAVGLLRGPVGKPVILGIERQGFPDTLTFKLIRDIISIHSVRYTSIENIGYIRISQFTERTAEELDVALAALAQRNPRGLILDLRDNPGGVLTGAIAVASRFIDSGTIVSVVSRDPRQTISYSAAPVNGTTKLPLAVLINSYSASASEIVTGAVQDHRRGVVIGVKSYGKGSVQTVENLPEGAKMALTTARYALPSGRSIHGIGVSPDSGMSLEMPILTDSDLKALKALQDTDIIRNYSYKKADYSSEDIDNLEKLVSAAGIEISRETLERRYVAELARRNDDRTYLIPRLDPQLKKAIDVLKAAQKLEPTTARN